MIQEESKILSIDHWRLWSCPLPFNNNHSNQEEYWWLNWGIFEASRKALLIFTFHFTKDWKFLLGCFFVSKIVNQTLLIHHWKLYPMPSFNFVQCCFHFVDFIQCWDYSRDEMPLDIYISPRENQLKWLIQYHYLNFFWLRIYFMTSLFLLVVTHVSFDIESIMLSNSIPFQLSDCLWVDFLLEHLLPNCGICKTFFAPPSTGLQSSLVSSSINDAFILAAGCWAFFVNN